MFKNVTLLGFALLMFAVGAPAQDKSAGASAQDKSTGQDKKAWQPHPLAPSIPLLSEEEYTKIEEVIDRFIDYDSGKLPGGDGKKILADFNALGPEAIPPLIE